MEVYNDDISYSKKSAVKIEKKNLNEKDGNICYSKIFDIGEYDYKKMVLYKLYVMFFKERFFDDLRTKQQLGYIVGLGELIIIKDIILDI